MKNYEKLSDTCKIWWDENFELTNEKHTQVSGYIFNDKNQLLIVKNGKTWTTPGGHPEEGETPLETLKREVMEEGCVTLKDIKYLGGVEVVDKVSLPAKRNLKNPQKAIFVDINSMLKFNKNVA